MKYRIIGDTVQTIAIELAEGDSIFSRLGTFLFAKGAVKSETAPKGGYWSSVKSGLAGKKDPPLVVYQCETGEGLVGFQSPGPGRIHVVKLDGATRITVRRSALLIASEGVLCDPVHLDGEDKGTVPEQVFITLGGSGWAFLHGAGNLIDFSLNTGEQMVVDGSMILAFDAELTYEPRPAGKPGSKGKEPYMLLMHLTGPGGVILHTQQMD